MVVLLVNSGSVDRAGLNRGLAANPPFSIASGEVCHVSTRVPWAWLNAFLPLIIELIIFAKEFTKPINNILCKVRLQSQ